MRQLAALRRNAHVWRCAEWRSQARPHWPSPGSARICKHARWGSCTGLGISVSHPLGRWGAAHSAAACISVPFSGTAALPQRKAQFCSRDMACSMCQVIRRLQLRRVAAARSQAPTAPGRSRTGRRCQCGTRKPAGCRTLWWGMQGAAGQGRGAGGGVIGRRNEPVRRAFLGKVCRLWCGGVLGT